MQKIKDNNRSRTRLSGTGVFFGDVEKRFIERRYSHLRFRRLIVPFEITLMFVNSDAALVSQAQAEMHVCR